MYIYTYLYIYRGTQFQIESWNQHLNVNVFRAQNHLSGHAHSFPPIDRHLQHFPNVIRRRGWICRRPSFPKTKNDVHDIEIY